MSFKILAEAVGFEPTVPVKVQRFSRGPLVPLQYRVSKRKDSQEPVHIRVSSESLRSLAMQQPAKNSDFLQFQLTPKLTPNLGSPPIVRAVHFVAAPGEGAELEKGKVIMYHEKHRKTKSEVGLSVWSTTCLASQAETPTRSIIARHFWEISSIARSQATNQYVPFRKTLSRKRVVV